MTGFTWLPDAAWRGVLLLLLVHLLHLFVLGLFLRSFLRLLVVVGRDGFVICRRLRCGDHLIDVVPFLGSGEG